MSKHSEARRTFLKGAAVGAGAVAGLVPETLAQTAPQPPHTQHTESPNTTAHAQAGGHGAFFNDDDAATVAALAERIMPGAPGKPGASEAGVLNYIDLALAGAYSDLQDFYRRGLAALDGYCRATFKQGFAALDSARQDAVMGAMEQGKAGEFTWPSAQAFFNTVRTHTMEGMFADPIYGGNKDFAGWTLIGFPGAQPLFSPSDLASKEAFAGAPIIGLKAQSKAPTRRT
jgi:gluconate 2-dehydrogenase gamma chain